MSDLVQLIRREILALVTTSDGGAKEVEEIKKQIQQLRNDVDGINHKLSAQQGELASVTARVSAIESGFSALSNRVADQRASISQLSGDVGAINSSLSTLGNRIDAAEQGISQLVTRTDDLTSRTSTLEATSSSLTTDVASLNTRVTTELDDIRANATVISGRVDALERDVVTSVGQGLEKTGNSVKVIAGNGMWFNSQNQIQLDLSAQMKGVGFEGSGMIAKIDGTYFMYNSSGQITLKDNISGLPSRTSALESLRIDTVAPPLVVQESQGSRSLRLLYDAVDFRVVNQAFTLVTRASIPTYRFPLDYDASANIVTLSPNYRIRTGQWTGQLQYQTPTINWSVPVTVKLMRVNDWLILSFSRFSTGAILASGKFVLNFVPGLSAGWPTGSTEPSSTTDPLSTTFAAIQFVNGSSRVDAFRILGVTEWDAGELEISNYGGTYTAHTGVDWAPMTLMYPCLG
uniref:Viral attachment protein sigma 1 n=1 Tax=Reovirus type 2 (strain D5/Jones) TaxID=10885 RepID=Q5G297_REOVJ|nr:viral attachment protein sigma 1 [Mammalian orthoreovirus 2]